MKKKIIKFIAKLFKVSVFFESKTEVRTIYENNIKFTRVRGRREVDSMQIELLDSVHRDEVLNNIKNKLRYGLIDEMVKEKLIAEACYIDEISRNTIVEFEVLVSKPK